MSVNPLLRSNPIRMMGMASGMDTQSIIDATLRMHQFRIDAQLRNRTMIEWRQDLHRDIRQQITGIRQTFLSNLGSKSLMNRNAFNASTATAVTSTGAAARAVTVTSTVGASVGSMKINEVVSLAKGASASSSGALSASGNGFTTGQTIGSMEFAGGKINFSNYTATVTGSEGSATITQDEFDSVAWSSYERSEVAVGGNSFVILRENGVYTWGAQNESGEFMKGIIEFDADGKGTLRVKGPYDDPNDGVFSSELADNDVLGIGKISISDKDGNIRLSVKDDDDKTVIAERTQNFFHEKTITQGDNEIKFYQSAGSDTVMNNGRAVNFVGTTSIKINDATINLTSNMTLTEMMNAVNSNADANVTMRYDRMQDRFTIESKIIDYTPGSSLVVENGTEAGNNITEMLFGSTGRVSEGGSKAQIRVNDTEIIERDTNSFEYRGIIIRLNETTDEEIIVNVERDTSKAVESIVEFIDSYNALISKLEGLLTERKTGREASYKPLTDEEKSVMSEKQIEEWEAIAKKGILRNDSGLENLVNSLRRSFFEQIEGTGLSASQIGLSTGSYFDGTGGQIIVDRDRLAAAIEADPDRVADVFIRIDTTDPANPRGVGLLHKINDLMRDYVNITQSNSTNALERSLKEANDRIARMEERMWAEEDRLYRQFAAMETAMSRLQSQGDWFSAMLGGM